MSWTQEDRVSADVENLSFTPASVLTTVSSVVCDVTVSQRASKLKATQAGDRLQD